MQSSASFLPSDLLTGRTHCKRWVCRWLAGLLLLRMLIPVGVGADTIEPVPPFMLQGVAPNLVVSFDNSDTMLRADAPTLATPTLGDLDLEGNFIPPRWHYFCSPDVNQLYYQPTKFYRPPLYHDGRPFTAADFAGAWQEPYRECHRTDLSNNYRVVQKFAADDHRCPDVSTFTIDPIGSPAFYHLFAPADNVNCDLTDADIPDDRTPDVCFRKIVVGSAADLAFANCTGLTDLPAAGRYPGQVCTPNPGLPDLDLKTNFANWYSYYRIRSLAAKTALSRAMFGMNPRVRLGWQTDWAGDLQSGQQGFEQLAATLDSYHLGQRQRFYRWMQQDLREGLSESRIVSSVIRAGELYRSDLAQSDNVPAVRADPSQFQRFRCGVKCRQNFHLLLTDGDWRDHWPDEQGRYPCPGGGKTCELATSPNQDGIGHDLPANDSLPAYPFGVQKYPARGTENRLYWDENIGMMADAAFHYWVTDLRPDASNQVVPNIQVSNPGSQEFDAVNFWNPRNDPATWQHMRTFVVGFGPVGAVTPIADEDGVFVDGFYTDEAGQERQLSRAGFPGRWSSFDDQLGARDPGFMVAKIDDLFHTTLNARGRYFSAADPLELERGFRSVMETVSTALGSTSNTSVAFDMGALTTHTLAYQVLVDTADWTSKLVAWTLWDGIEEDAAKGCPDYFRRYPQARPAAHVRGMPCKQAWEAADRLAKRVATDRVILTTVKGELKAFRPLSFDLADTNDPQIVGLFGCLSAGDAACTDFADWGQRKQALAERVAWLRGDQRNEIGGGGAFRTRAGLLGDIIYSNLAYVGPANRLFADADYRTFQANNRDRKPMLYVGSNDGMLHAFDASNDGTGGEELFAYIPQAVYAGLGRLTEPDYPTAKRAFVDGGISTADVKLAAGWRTVLVGTLGGGGRGAYALDITQPSSITENSSDLLLWEFSEATSDAAEMMGYSIAPPAIVRRRDGSWVALVSNGFDNPSADGNAVLFVLKMDGDGSTPMVLDTKEGKAKDPRQVGRINALALATAVSNQGDLVADAAYAGDLFGNLWRFNLTDLTKAPARLFRARDSEGQDQPITSGVAVQRHPSGVGTLVLFGTGKYLNTDDKADLSRQTFYAIWDTTGSRLTCGQSGASVTRSDLAKREFSSVVTVTAPQGVQVVSRGRTLKAVGNSDRLAWGKHCGWYVDLKDDDLEGERVIAQPQVRIGRVLFVSVIPGDCCASGGTSWINALDASTGLALPSSPFDFDQDGAINFGDLLEIADGTDGARTAVGVSIRPETEGDGFYTNPSTLVLPGGELLNIITDSHGEMIPIREATGLDWRNWHQLQ